MGEKVKMLPVTQADRDAAYALWSSEGVGPTMHEAWPQAFARHRIAAEQTLNGELVEAAKAVLTALEGDFPDTGGEEDDGPVEHYGMEATCSALCFHHIRRLAAALKALIAEKGGGESPSNGTEEGGE